MADPTVNGAWGAPPPQQPYQQAPPGYYNPPPQYAPQDYNTAPLQNGTAPVGYGQPVGIYAPPPGQYAPSGVGNYGAVGTVAFGQAAAAAVHGAGPMYDPPAGVYGQQTSITISDDPTPTSNTALTGTQKMSADLPTSIRHGFIRKVYCILIMQLLVTFGMALFFGFYEPAGLWLKQNNWLMITSSILSIVVLLILVCVPGLAQNSPINLILLTVFSMLFGVIIGYAAVVTSMDIFIAALGATMGIVLILTIFAFQVKYDFTGAAPYMIVILFCFMFFGIFAMIFRSSIMNIVYGSIGALIFSLYLVMDTQMIAGGKHTQYQFSIDDYVLGALTLYLDIINLFSMILTIMDNA